MNYANNNIQELKPYNPPLDERRNFDGLLLDFNERTIPVSDKVKKALIEFVLENKIQIYPEYKKLIDKLSDYTGLDNDSLLLINGSDEGINLIIQTFTEKNDKVIIPSPSFAMHNQYCEIRGNKIIDINYKQDLSFPLEEVLDQMNNNVRLLILCNPNSPIGSTISLNVIESILKKAKQTNTLVYVDEAYFEFCGITAVSLISEYTNLIITRTFSKAFALASLRLGYLLSAPKNIKELKKVISPYSVNMAAAVAGSAALDDLGNMKEYVNEVMNRSKPVLEGFFITNNILFYKSNSNFILFKYENSKIFLEKFRNKGILLRSRKGKNIDGTIRVTVGTLKQTKEFIKTFNKLK